MRKAHRRYIRAPRQRKFHIVDERTTRKEWDEKPHYALSPRCVITYCEPENAYPVANLVSQDVSDRDVCSECRQKLSERVMEGLSRYLQDKIANRT